MTTMNQTSARITAAALRCIDLGRAAYAPTLALQQRLVDAVARGALGPHLLLVEHLPAVITLGRRARAEHVLLPPEQLARRGVEVHHISRGGDVTYHGPGQLVVYPILALRAVGCSLREYQRRLEEALIRALADHDVQAGRVEGATGVWVGQRKIAAIGIAARRWVTYHGLALNVTTDLQDFGLIVPCGITDCGVTSLAELGRPASVERVKPVLVRRFAEVFGFAPPDEPAVVSVEEAVEGVPAPAEGRGGTPPVG